MNVAPELIMQSVKFDVKGTVDKIEDKINQYSTDAFPSLLLDLSEVDFIRIESLICLISFIARRTTKGQETKIKYYANENIRSYLHNSRFFETVESVTGIGIRNLVIDLPNNFENTVFSKDYFYRNKVEFIEHGRSSVIVRELTGDERVAHWIDKGFYPLICLPFGTNLEKSITLKEEPKNWTEGKPIVSIIQRHLPDKVIIGNKISKDIIYESITNAIRHPNSKKLVIGCIRQQNAYTIVIWDNGDSIITTLKTELEKGNSIKTKELSDDPHSCYCIVKEQHDVHLKDDDIQYYFSDEVPVASSASMKKEEEYKKSDWFILLSSLFPGITRDAKGDDYKTELFKNTETPILGGRGLTNLINTAVRNFGGEVRIRTGNYFMNIKKADKDYVSIPKIFFNKFKNDYFVIDMQEKYASDGINPEDKKILNSIFRAKIKSNGEFYGNMITIHIPQNPL